MQLSRWRESKATDAEKLLSQWEKGAKCNFKSNAQVHERYFFLMKWNVICNAEDRFSCLELFLRAKNTNAVRAKNTNAVFSATKQMKRMQGQGCWKASSQWEKGAKCNFNPNGTAVSPAIQLVFFKTSAKDIKNTPSILVVQISVIHQLKLWSVYFFCVHSRIQQTLWFWKKKKNKQDALFVFSISASCSSKTSLKWTVTQRKLNTRTWELYL